MRRAKEDDLATLMKWHLEEGWLSDPPVNKIYHEVYGDGWIVAEQDGELVGEYYRVCQWRLPWLGMRIHIPFLDTETRARTHTHTYIYI